MSPKRRTSCQVCERENFKYTCSSCLLVYCSLPCYKRHKESSCNTKPVASNPHEHEGEETPSTFQDARLSTEIPPLRPLTTLRWPYVPEESEFPDPLKRDDPRPLNIPQYEAIATSPAVRQVLALHPDLPALLTAIDIHRGHAREEALERALGLAPEGIAEQARHTGPVRLADDVVAMRELAAAIEAAVRGGKQDALGLDWGDQL